MRELLVCPQEMRTRAGPVHRLRFDATGRELVAWVEPKPVGGGRYGGVAAALYAHDLGTGSVRALPTDDWFNVWGEVYPDPVVSHDLRFFAAEINLRDGETYGFVQFHDLRNADVRLPELELQPTRSVLLFAPDALLAVRSEWDDGEYALDVARFDLSAFTKAPLRFYGSVDPVTFVPVRVLKVNPRWKRVVALPRSEPACAAALSADGRLIAVGTEDTTVHVADLKRKKVLASFPWEGRALRHSAVRRVELAPGGGWVVALASGRLFARPLDGGKGWKTKEALGDLQDFAFHPSGRVLCAVFADGQARHLDPLTGAVRQAFRWSKKPLYSVTFAPDGLTCAAGRESGKVVIWDVDA
jgi:WD40 repeat protein